MVKAYSAENEELDSETIKDITLYVFDRDGQFIRAHTEHVVNHSVEFNYPDHDRLTVVAWGNGAQGSQSLPTLNVGDKIEEAFVTLSRTRASMATIQSPDDLTHGLIELTKENQNVEAVLSMSRKTSGVSLTARELKQYANASDDNFSYVLRQTGHQLDFFGNESGELSAYTPQASFDGNGDFAAPIFNILTTSSDIEVDILHGDILVATILKTPDGKPLRVEPGKTLNIMVDFTGDISVSVSLTPWGEGQIWKDFN